MRHLDIFTEDFDNVDDWIPVDRVSLDSYLDYLATGEWQ